jgi:hypothetical protein
LSVVQKEKLFSYNQTYYKLYVLHSLSWSVVDAIKQTMGSFVSFTFSTKILCGVNKILTVIAVIQIQNLRQAFMSKSRDFMSRNVNTE